MCPEASSRSRECADLVFKRRVPFTSPCLNGFLPKPHASATRIPSWSTLTPGQPLVLKGHQWWWKKPQALPAYLRASYSHHHKNLASSCHLTITHTTSSRLVHTGQKRSYKSRLLTNVRIYVWTKAERSGNRGVRTIKICEIETAPYYPLKRKAFHLLTIW